MPEFKKNPSGMKPSGFKMKGYSYPGTSPLKGAKAKARKADAAAKADEAMAKIKEFGKGKVDSTDLLSGGGEFTVDASSPESPIAKKASPARYEPDLSAEIVPVDDPRNSANNKPSPKPKQEDPKPKNVVKPGKNMSSTKFEYSDAGKAPEAPQTPPEKPVTEKIKVHTTPPSKQPSKMSEFLGSEAGGAAIDAGIQLAAAALMPTPKKTVRRGGEFSGFSKMKFGRS